MGIFVNNVNHYLSELKIKQSYVCLMTGIEKNKLSRILKGAQDITSMDMEKIAGCLGKSVEFFLSEEFKAQRVYLTSEPEIVFCAGDPSEKQEEFAEEFLKFIENADLILGAKKRYMLMVEE